MIEPPFFKILPNRGEYYIMDVNAGDTVKNTIFPCPTKLGKGILVAPTVHGNLIVGPNSEDVVGNDISTTAAGQEYVKKFALRSVPDLNFRDSIRNFAGVRSPSDLKDDFIVGESEYVPGFFNMAGIKSPGLTSAPAIAIDMVKMFADKGLELIPNPKFTGKRKVTRIADLSNEERAQKVKENPLYGKIVCRCRTITEGEIVDALRRPIPPVSVDAVKRRVMAGSGRCQGGFCGPRVQSIIARELGIPKKDVPLDRVGMNIIIGETKAKEGAR
jgi:glycerol-3-phosphate dehydrogenase